MKTIGSKVLVKIEETEQLVQKINNLTIPVDTNNNSFDTAVIVEVGDMVPTNYPEVKAGVKVYIPKSQGIEFREGDSVMRVIDVNDIIVIL